uniref:Uncharacterized protein n=1 Tax=Fagus sylvatica TaxID=28930 RepID=A0A2N9GY19_FAGSY
MSNTDPSSSPTVKPPLNPTVNIISVPQATVARTRVIKNSSDPIWNEHFGPSDPSFNRKSKLRSTTSSTSSPTAPPSTTSSDPSSSPTAALNHELADRPVERRMACFAV